MAQLHLPLWMRQSRRLSDRDAATDAKQDNMTTRRLDCNTF
jgi:hypothetical protein